ncbi:MAG: HlyD family efflux transporter periplasmic adaptor subunit [Bauldia sp.]|uniref:HlyD family secretion protein n=1 Tax=Bauldia sp. TaxID=2575872 RepID=UPI001E03A517|nr:HlyD family efflux transporter periplasmic adaptor subunit [Bauldia sp.]MCB1495473.1 HlyD family efflux transporter periplasmic adaptor subunit [Bauldia sp.]
MKALVIASALLLAGCFGTSDTALQGYIEGTYVYVSAETAGRVVARPVDAGAMVGEGDVVVRLDDADEKEAVTRAEALLAQARAQLANLLSGKRPEEIGVIVAELSEARATFKIADEDYTRQLQLREKGVVAATAVDNAKAKRDAAKAKVEAIERQLEVAKLPAREEEIDAAERYVAAQASALARTRIALERRTLKAPSAGFIEETFFEPGERVAAGEPVVSLLPGANKKVRFFLPEPMLAEIALGDRVSISCDNCDPDMVAEIDFIATESEFTPPVIYSKDNREKLVFRVEARPLGAAGSLKVGQPIDVRILGGAGS